MINQLWRSFTLDTKNAAVGVIGICIEPHHFPVCYGCNGSAVGGAKRAVTAHGVRGVGEIIHTISSILQRQRAVEWEGRLRSGSVFERPQDVLPCGYRLDASHLLSY